MTDREYIEEQTCVQRMLDDGCPNSQQAEIGPCEGPEREPVVRPRPPRASPAAAHGAATA